MSWPQIGWRKSQMTACFSLMAQVAPAQVSLVVVFVAVRALLQAALLIITGMLISALPGLGDHSSGLARGSDAIGLVSGWSALILLLQLPPRVIAALSMTIAGRLDAAVQERVMMALARPWTICHLDDPRIAELLLRVRSVGMGGIGPGRAAQTLINGRAQGFLVGVVAGCLLFGYRWWAACFLLSLQAMFALSVRKSYLVRAHEQSQQSAVAGRREYYRDLGLAPAAAKDFRLFGLAEWLVGRIRADRAGASMASRARHRRADGASIAAACLVMGGQMMVYAQLALDAADGSISIGGLVVFLAAARTISAMTSLNSNDYQVEHGLLAIAALAELERLTAAAGNAGTGALPPDAPAIALRFEKISFRYPGSPEGILDEFDLEIPAGRSVAIVGLNAAGKSTIVKLLTRLYEPCAGRITVDGVDIRSISPQRWRSRIATLFQDFQRYPISVRDNIAFGAVHLQDDAALRSAARKAGILDFIEAMPLGWETPLAPQFTDGIEISGGQWQRVGLARAFFAVESGARILVLDEPAANLDVRAETALFDEVLSLAHNLTTILISHRYATVRRADLICVIEGGKVAEMGSHDQLIAKRGTYARLFALQSVRFSADRAGA